MKWLPAWILAAGCAAASGCATARVPLLPHPAPVDRHRADAGDWRLTVWRDRFSGEVSCRLAARNRKAFVAGDAVAFAFPRGWNTQAAIYRIDGGEPRKWREDLPELIRIGAPIDRGGVDNPAQGLVWLPLRRLDDANSVAIEARPDRAPRTFHFRGLKGLYQTAVARGCAPASRFVR